MRFFRLFKMKKPAEAGSLQSSGVVRITDGLLRLGALIQKTSDLQAMLAHKRHAGVIRAGPQHSAWPIAIAHHSRHLHLRLTGRARIIYGYCFFLGRDFCFRLFLGHDRSLISWPDSTSGLYITFNPVQACSTSSGTPTKRVATDSRPLCACQTIFIKVLFCKNRTLLP